MKPQASCQLAASSRSLMVWSDTRSALQQQRPASAQQQVPDSVASAEWTLMRETLSLLKSQINTLEQRVGKLEAGQAAVQSSGSLADRVAKLEEAQAQQHSGSEPGSSSPGLRPAPPGVPFATATPAVPSKKAVSVRCPEWWLRRLLLCVRHAGWRSSSLNESAAALSMEIALTCAALCARC